jgi:hypothetical protein
MKTIFNPLSAILAVSAVALCVGGCASLTGTAQHLAATPAGSKIVSSAADKVIQKGLNAGADKLDATGNPYLHSVADALRSNPDGIVDPAFVQKIFTDYGDPENKAKFKTLALDVWQLAKDAAIRFGKENAAELLAKGLQDGATNSAKPSTVSQGP